MENNILIEPSIIRGARDSSRPYFSMLKSPFRDKDLSPRDKGVLAFLFTLPDDWITHPRHIAKEMGVSKNLIYSALNSLLKHGYANKITTRSEGGRFATVIYKFYDEKLPEEDRFKEKITVSQNPYPVNPDTEKGTLQIKDSTEKISKDINTSLKVFEKTSKVDVEPDKPERKKEKTVIEFSEEVKSVTNKMKDLLEKHCPVYRLPEDMTKFQTAVREMVEKDKQDENVILQTFEWGISDNEQRGDFKGWQSVIVKNKVRGKVTSPANLFRDHFMGINSQMNSRPKRKFSPSSDQNEAAHCFKELWENAIE